jgi:hypothetical protein
VGKIPTMGKTPRADTVREQIVIRFVAERGPLAWLIRYQAGIAMPFTPNHVESVSPDGQWYYGEHIKGGLAKRPKGYDAKTVLAEFFIEIPCTADQRKAYYAYLESKLGMSYDWRSLVSFAIPSWNLHGRGELICSAITASAMRKGKILPYILTVPFHHITPRDILLMCSVLVNVPHPEMQL